MSSSMPGAPKGKVNELAPRELRPLIGTGQVAAPTAGLAPGYVQCNVVILPQGDAAEFEEFCRLNRQPCPLIDVTAPAERA